MEFPPSWYVLLIGSTLLAAPILLRRSLAREDLRLLVRLLVGLALFELGLVLLFYSVFVCWTMVAAGVAVIASGAPGRAWSPPLAMLVPATAAGVAFQALPEPFGYYFYFGFGIPLLLLVSVGFALADRLRWRADGRMLMSVAAVLGVGALTPASAFAFTFLYHYEIFHLPVLVVALVALSWATGRADVVGARVRVRTVRGIGDRIVGSARLARSSVMASAAGLLAALPVVLLSPPSTLVLVAWGLLAISGSLVIVGVVRPGAAWAVAPFAACSGLVAIVLAAMEVVFVLQAAGGGPAPASLLLYVAGGSACAFGLAATLSMAWAREATVLRKALKERWRHGGRSGGQVPADLVLEEEHPGMPDTAHLEGFRERARAHGVRSGILRVAIPLDPLAGLPAEVDAWLADQREGPIVHLAVREGDEVFFVPIIDPEERAG